MRQANSSKAAAGTRVHVISGSDLDQMARRALEAVGGAKAIVKPGEAVFIKPNFVTAGAATTKPIFRNGECAKLEIVRAVVEECLRAGAAEVIVGDGAQVPRFAWEDLTTLDGSANLAAEARRLSSAYNAKVTLACLNSDTPEWVEVPTRTELGRIAVSSLVTRADRIISIPVLKTHVNAGLTLSIKNFMGVVSNERNGGYPFRSALHAAGLEQCFVDVVMALKPDLAIIDCSIGVEGNGPGVDPDGSRGQTVDMKERLGTWFLIASTDLLAADATAARIIGHDPMGVKQLQIAQAQGIGESREEAIEIVGGNLAEMRVKWAPAEIRPLRAIAAAGS